MYSPITNDDEEKGDPNKIKFKVSSPNSKLNVTSPNAKLNTSVLTDIEISSAPEVDEPQNDDPDEEDEDDDDDDEEEDLLGFWPALTWLAVITILISILSDYLVKSIEKAAAAWNISGIFLSAIVIPIIGNAAEHAGAVIFAMKNKLDLALGIAIGSSTQIALMVLPMLVIIGWMDRKSMTMNFQSYEATTLFLTVVTVTFAIKDGNSNWLIGAALLAAYVMISAGFWVHHDESLT
jgi:Ca2+:H+ antiporter